MDQQQQQQQAAATAANRSTSPHSAMSPEAAAAADEDEDDEVFEVTTTATNSNSSSISQHHQQNHQQQQYSSRGLSLDLRVRKELAEAAAAVTASAAADTGYRGYVVPSRAQEDPAPPGVEEILHKVLTGDWVRGVLSRANHFTISP